MAMQMFAAYLGCPFADNASDLSETFRQSSSAEIACVFATNAPTPMVTKRAWTLTTPAPY